MNVYAQRMFALAGAFISALSFLAAAQANGRPDDRAGTLGIREAQALVLRPDDRGGLHGVGATLSPTTRPERPDDRAGAHGVVLSPTRQATPAISNFTDAAFHWNDAALGSAATIGVLLLGGALLLSIRRRTGAAATF
jgi:hypothetical protein